MFLALCWPLLLSLHCMLAENSTVATLLSVAIIEFVGLKVCVELVCVLYTIDSVTIHPSIPRAKRPPWCFGSLLGSFLGWVNKSIDRMADDLAPCITVRKPWKSKSHRQSSQSCHVRHCVCFHWRLLPWWRSSVFHKWISYFQRNRTIPI